MHMQTADEPGASPPPEAAFAAYCKYAASLGVHPVVVIEGGYFEQRDPRAEDRMEHLRDSFLLVENLLNLPTETRPHVIIAVLINDFWSGGAYCGLDFCEPEKQTSMDATPYPTERLKLIPPEAWRIYQDHGEITARSHVKVFSMKSTRNKAAKALTRALKEVRDADSPLHEVFDGDVGDIHVYTDYEEVLLGHRHKGAYEMSLRCSALMAQHYYDLYVSAHRHVPRMTGLWIFDFDRFIEQDRVRAGAEASFVVYPWPKEMPVRVINCIYSPVRTRRPPLQITSRQTATQQRQA